MRVDAFHYELPPDRIAQRPTEDRERARLMHLVPAGSGLEHRTVAELPELLPRGALVVVNDTRVIPARLVGRKRATGGRVEVLLLSRLSVGELEVAPGDIRPAHKWTVMGKGPLRAHDDIEVGEQLRLRLLERQKGGKLLEVALFASPGEDIDVALQACGHVPLPPYIKREAEPFDAKRYQTVYARHDGAIAAPTAGLHLTTAILDRLAARGCDLASVTLHVGLGTFQPVITDDLDSHPMHAERYVVPQSAVDAISKARSRRAPVIAIGTTTLRALESAADPQRPGCVLATCGETRLLVQPGHPWQVVDGLLTNFHLPRSTLLALVCALGGIERVIDAYGVAVREHYRFFSYGDAMLLWRCA